MIFIVTIQDKTLYGEPDVALAVVDASDEASALRAAFPTIEQLADAGRGRCVPHARLVEPGKFYRLGAVVRLPRDPNADEPRVADDRCDCELRDRAWNPNTGTCQTCSRRYEVRR